MANDDLDDLKLDDFEDLDLDMSDPFASQKSTSRLKSLASGILSGAGVRLKDAGFYTRVFRKSLPKSFNKALDNSDHIKFAASTSYNKIASDYKSDFNEMKSFLPDDVAKFLGDDEESGGWDGYDEEREDRDAVALLSEGIEAQLNQNSSIAKARYGRDNRVDKAKLRSSALQIEHLSGINARLEASIKTQGIGLRFQEKQLEIQYKHYNVALKTFEVMHNDNKMMLRALGDIIRNTSLPDSFKQNLSDEKKGFSRKVMSRFGGGLFDNAKSRIAELASTKFGMYSPLLTAASSLKDTGDLISPWEIAGEFIGDLGVELAGEFIAEDVSKNLDGNNRLGKVGKKLGNFTSTLGGMARYGAAKNRFDPLKMTSDGFVKRFFKRKANEGLDFVTSLFDLGYDKEASNFSERYKDSEGSTIHTNKSLTTIIPGLLSRILRQVTITNTGNLNTPLVEYSIGRDKFVTDTRAKTDIVKSIRDAKKSTEATDLVNIVGELDPEGKLSPKAREALAMQMMVSGSSGMSFYHKNFTDKSYYSDIIGSSEKEELRSYFSTKNMDSEEYLDAESNAIDATANIRSSLDSFYQSLDDTIQKGGMGTLVQMGFVNRGSDGKPVFNEKAIFSYLINPNNDKDLLRKVLSGKITEAPAKSKRGLLSAFFNRKNEVKKERPRAHAVPTGINDNAAKQPDYTPERMYQPQRTDEDTKEYRNKTLSLLEAIKIAAEATQENTKEITVYIGDDIESSTVKGKRLGERELWIPGLNSLRRLGRGGIDLGLAGMKMYGNILGGFGNLANSGLKATGSIIHDTVNSLTRVNKIVDIYLKGDDNPYPILPAVKLKRGDYFDSKTGKVVKKLKHIKGDVRDADNNIIVREDQIKNLYVLDGSSFVGKAARLAGGAFVNALKPSYYLAKTMAMTTKVITDHINKPKDVYVKGEKDPRLTSIGMKSGVYFSRVTGKAIRSVKDIDGPVVDMDGESVLTLDDIRKGIVGANGKPIESLRYRLLKGIVKTVFTPIKLAWQLGTGMVSLGYKGMLKAGAIGKEAYRRLRGKRKLTSEESIIASQTNDILSAIYALLDNRLPQAPKWNDKDGDGIRDGSFMEDQDEEENDSHPTKKDNSKGPFSKGVLGALSSLFGGKSDDEEDDGDNFVNVDLGDGDKEDKNKNKKGKPKGRFGRAMGKAKSLFSKIPGAGLVSSGTRAVVGAGMRVAAVAGAGALMSSSGLLAGAGTALASAGAAVAGVISAPVVIGVAAVAGVAAGGYGLYRYMQGKKYALSKLRYCQYGINPENKEHIEVIDAMERLLINKVEFRNGMGNVIVDQDTAVKLLAIFNIDSADEFSIGRWTTWFSGRFKPIFLTYIEALTHIAGGKGLLEADSKLSEKEKLRLIEFVNFDSSNEGPLGISSGPFGFLASGFISKAVMERDNAIAELKENLEDRGSSRRQQRRNSIVRNQDDSNGTTAYNEITRNRRNNRSAIQGRQSGNRTAANAAQWLAPTTGVISSPFGKRIDPFTGKTVNHSGIDFAARKGTPVYSSSGGTISRIEYSQSYGNVIYINHDNNKQSRYAHLSAFADGMKLGDWVDEGALIGYVGNTGRSKGDHLHFEIVDLSKDGKKLDPLRMIGDDAAKEAKAALALAEKEAKKENKMDTSIEGVNTIHSTENRETVVQVDPLSRILADRDSERKSMIESEIRRERLEHERSKAVKDSIDNAVSVLEESLIVQKASHNELFMIRQGITNVSDQLSRGLTNRGPELAARNNVGKTTLSMDDLPVNNRKPS